MEKFSQHRQCRTATFKNLANVDAHVDVCIGEFYPCHTTMLSNGQDSWIWLDLELKGLDLRISESRIWLSILKVQGLTRKCMKVRMWKLEIFPLQTEMVKEKRVIFYSFVEPNLFESYFSPNSTFSHNVPDMIHGTCTSTTANVRITCTA